MNNYALNFIGSGAVLILLIISSFAISYFTYRFTVPPIAKSKKAFLVSLRSVSIALILFALFQPVFNILRTVAFSPSVGIFFDDSESMNIQEKGDSRKKEYQEAYNLSNVLASLPTQKNIAFSEDYRFIDKFAFDSLKLNGASTNLTKALYWASANKESENIKSLVVFTDGAFNSGDNPIYAVDNLSLPLYIIGIGDTSEKKDAVAQSLIMNEIGFVETKIPIQANIKVSGYANQNVKINFFDNKNLIGSQELQLKNGQTDYPITFVYSPKEEGIRKITAEISPLENEFSIKNNTISEYIKILKNKKKIALFAGAPSPDVSIIKNFLEQDKNLEVKAYIQKKGSEFYEQTPSPANIKEAEAFVLIGFPIASTPNIIIEQISEELKSSKPLFFVNSLMTDYSKLKSIEAFLPFNIVSARNLEYLATPDVKPEFLSNPILRITGTEEDAEMWNSAPPLFRTEIFTRVKPEAQIAMETKVGQASIKEPLCAVREAQGSKCVAMLGYGLYRWKLLGTAADKARGASSVDLTETFLNNTIRWLSVNENRKNFKLKTTKKFYSMGEKIEIIAEAYDKSFVPLEEASVNIKVSGAGESRELLLNSIGGGKYSAYIEGLKSGDYFIEGSAVQANISIGRDNWRFDIGETPIEYLNPKMNADFLKTLANRSGGKFYTIENAHQLIDDLKKNGLLEDTYKTKLSEIQIWNSPYLFALIALLLSIEWFIRKRSSLL